VVKRRAARVEGAATRRLRALAPTAATVRDAVVHVVTEFLHDVSCPPTDLIALARKVGVHEIVYESFPGSGELHRVKGGYRIVCSSDQPRSRQRFTVAHELAHIILARTGKNAPREGREVERLCDMLATECLMPTAAFESEIPPDLTIRAISALADRFETSLTATARRCAELRSACVFGVDGERVTWGYGGVRPGPLMLLLDEVRENVEAVMSGGHPRERVFFYTPGHRGGYRRFDWMRMKNGCAMFLIPADRDSSAPRDGDRPSYES
jgi:hypothetical protein